jgi:cytidylate kinase
MAVITVSREAGSGGTQIAKMAAKTLGYHLARSLRRWLSAGWSNWPDIST